MQRARRGVGRDDVGNVRVLDVVHDDVEPARLAELEMKTTQSSGPMSCARKEAASVVAGETAFAPTCDNLVATIWANESEVPTPVRWRMKSAMRRSESDRWS